MALVERLMGDPFSTDAEKISVHDFFAAQQEIISGRLTVANVKTFLAMDTEAAAEYDLMVALAPTGTSAGAKADKALYLGGIHSVFLLAEGRYPGYSTPTEVRLKLGI